MEVHHRLRRDEREDYARVAKALPTCADVVSLQHDATMWGGPDGEWILDFVAATRLPIVATLHAIPVEPTLRQREILVELLATVRQAVVMSGSAATLLHDAYGVDPTRLAIIPHGVPNLPLVESDSIKPATELAGREVILSFGLLGPGKGVEMMLEAMPAVVAARPTATYVIVGATHPDIPADKEAYRGSLTRRAAALGLGDHVRFIDRFVGRVELTRWLESADVFVTPYPDLGQTVSGTLSHAMGAGRAIVSTPFAYATDLLAEGRGVLLPAASASNPKALAAEVIGLLADAPRRLEIGQLAYTYSRPMVWTSVGAAYQGLFNSAA
jgi:glycosyltransferase involved in cell wall biosynthesis